MNTWSGELFIDQGWACYRGPVGDTRWHQHSALQVCFTLKDSLCVEIENTGVTSNPALVINTNARHRIMPGNDYAELLFIESTSVLGIWIKRQLNGQPVYFPGSGFDIYLPPLITSQSILQSRISGLWPDTNLQLSLDPMDNRIRQILNLIETQYEPKVKLKQLADKYKLSSSRLRHLFAEQVGMPLSRYLLWLKLKRAVTELGKQSSLTQAAHAGGFCDSAHLSRTFRKMFGISPGDFNTRGKVILSGTKDTPY